MIRETMSALAACIVTVVLCSAAYPAAVWAVAWAAFPHQAAGSLVERDGKVIGSELIAQPFASDGYFQPRPSACDYKADATGGSNLGTKNPDLRAKVKERAEALKATAENPAPTELISASGSGMDPDISPETAVYQAARVAAARRISAERVRALIDGHVNRSGTIIGAPPRVNVLALNLDLDREAPAPPAGETKPESAARPEAPAAAADEVGAIRDRISALSAQVERLGKRIEAIPPPRSAQDVKEIEGQVAKLAEAGAPVAPLVERMGRIDARLTAADQTVKSLTSALGQARAALKQTAAAR